jgi:hypothetical protein
MTHVLIIADPPRRSHTRVRGSNRERGDLETRKGGFGSDSIGSKSKDLIPTPSALRPKKKKKQKKRQQPESESNTVLVA